MLALLVFTFISLSLSIKKADWIVIKNSELTSSMSCIKKDIVFDGNKKAYFKLENNEAIYTSGKLYLNIMTEGSLLIELKYEENNIYNDSIFDTSKGRAVS